MLLLEPSLRYVLGGNFLSAVQSEGAAAAELFHAGAAHWFFQTKSFRLSVGYYAHQPLQVRGFLSEL